MASELGGTFARVRVLRASQRAGGRAGSASTSARARALAPGEALVRAAEPSVVVDVARPGRGGRATHLATLVARELGPGVAFLAGASDGVDGTSGTGGRWWTRRCGRGCRSKHSITRSSGSIRAAARVGGEGPALRPRRGRTSPTPRARARVTAQTYRACFAALATGAGAIASSTRRASAQLFAWRCIASCVSASATTRSPAGMTRASPVRFSRRISLPLARSNR